MALLALLLALTLGLAACAEPEQQPADAADEGYSLELFAMDTLIALNAYGPLAAQALPLGESMINEAERRLSATLEGSEVYACNQANGAPVRLSADSAALLAAALDIAAATGGAFDISVYPLMREWGFPDGDYQLPEPQRIAELLDSVGYRALRLDGDTLTMPAGYAIDLGGIAKGDAAQRVIDAWRELGVEHGIISLGGNVQALGARPDGSPWRVGLTDPLAPQQVLGVIELTDGAAVTSGGYQRYFEAGGRRYHHLLDPADGYPADSGLLSVTVLCADGASADALSTALFVMGREAALDYWRAHDDIELLLIDEQRRVTATEGAAARFALDEGAGYSYEICYRAAQP